MSWSPRAKRARGSPKVPWRRRNPACNSAFLRWTPQLFRREAAALVVDVPATPAWMRRELTRGVTGDRAGSRTAGGNPRGEILEEPAPQAPAATAVDLAPITWRLLAIVVDCALVTAAFLAAALLAAAHASQLPGPRTAELGAALAVLVIGAAYQAFFFALAGATPGMRYAGIGLCTLDGFNPSRAQRWGRLVALPLSVLPLGLGLPGPSSTTGASPGTIACRRPTCASGEGSNPFSTRSARSLPLP